MSSFVPFNRDQAFRLLPDLGLWLPEGDATHFVSAAADCVPLGSFEMPTGTGGKPQRHPRLMLALPIHCHAQGLFSSRRVGRATCRDVAVRLVSASLHPDHDTIAALQRTSKAAISAASPARFGGTAFLHVLLLAREAGLLRLGTASINGTKVDANASKFRSVRCDRARVLREAGHRHRCAGCRCSSGRRRGPRSAGAAGGVGPARSVEG